MNHETNQIVLLLQISFENSWTKIFV